MENGVLSQVALVVSSTQQRNAKLRVSDLTNANNMIGKLQNPNVHVVYKTMRNTISIRLCSLADGAHTTNRDCGQTKKTIGVLV